MPKKQPVSELLVELSWARLYVKKIQEHLDVISTALEKAEHTAAGTELMETATLLREHLKHANLAITELRDNARVRPAASKQNSRV
jgi:septation ring formation regulator EzrA